MDEKKEILLLSRNEPLELYCHVCKKKPAVDICVVHYDGNNLFCEKCSKKHEGDCEYEALFPVVNSPRMGVCGYDGGRIDVERDGVFQMKK